MQINITGHQMEITDTLRQYVENAVNKLSSYSHTAIGNVHVVLEVNKQEHHCHLSVHIGSDNYDATDNNDNMYNAIDRAVDKIRRQINKVKSHAKEARRH